VTEDKRGKQGGQQAGKGKRAARDRLATERQRQAQADRRKRQTSNVLIAVVVVVVVVGIVGYAWWASNQSDAPTTADLPALVQEQGGGVVVGDGATEVNLWEDFQCPSCKAFEAQFGSTLRDKVDSGDVTMTIHPLSFLDQNLGNSSSVLAANAFGCAADVGEAEALDFHLTVYANQPEENPGQEAWDADALIAMGNTVGLEGDAWESCVRDQPYSDWVAQVAASQLDAGITSTPTVLIDGKKVANITEFGKTLDEAIAAQ
jgi:protein-disulfide isomerase